MMMNRLSSIGDWFLEVTNAPLLYLPEMGFPQVLDILILTVLLYIVVRWIRRTQAWVLLKGIGLILFLALLAEIFELVTVQWLVDNTIGMGLVVVVILFQPELRDALRQIGRSSNLINLKNEHENDLSASEQTADEIIKAARIMSKSLTGALIVIVKNVELTEHELTGVPLDAKITSQLLVSIFEKNAPLHDGAVFIKNNRITAATCICPLTAEHLDSSYGTRHRAAVGISEISDARVVVVSEESGKVSLVMDGEITRGLSDTALKEALVWGDDNKSRFRLFDLRRRKKNK